VKDVLVDQSTHMRAARSLRAQTMARPSCTSPLCTPDGKAGARHHA